MMERNGQIVAAAGLLFMTFPAAVSASKNAQPLCRIDTFGVNLICACSKNGDHFISCDFSALPNNVTILDVGSLQFTHSEPNGMAKCSATNGYSALDFNAEPLARETHLGVIRFCSFDFDSRGSKRVNWWLNNIKHSLAQMVILEGKLTTLKANLLAGFEKLFALTILRTGLQLIEPNAFSAMGNLPSLEMLAIRGNKLETFDWGLLQAVAPTLTSASLANNSISTMKTTSSLRFPKLSSVDLRENNLTDFSVQVLYMWAHAIPNTRYKTVNLQHNPLCPNENCRCSPFIPLVTFYQDPENVIPLRIHFNCGIIGYKWESTDPYNLGTCHKRRGFGRFLTNGDCKRKQSSDTEDFSPELAIESYQEDNRSRSLVDDHDDNNDNFAQ